MVFQIIIPKFGIPAVNFAIKFRDRLILIDGLDGEEANTSKSTSLTSTLGLSVDVLTEVFADIFSHSFQANC
jgi:hypothetical protein